MATEATPTRTPPADEAPASAAAPTEARAADSDLQRRFDSLAEEVEQLRALKRERDAAQRQHDLVELGTPAMRALLEDYASRVVAPAAEARAAVDPSAGKLAPEEVLGRMTQDYAARLQGAPECRLMHQLVVHAAGQLAEARAANVDLTKRAGDADAQTRAVAKLRSTLERVGAGAGAAGANAASVVSGKRSADDADDGVDEGRAAAQSSKRARGQPTADDNDAYRLLMAHLTTKATYDPMRRR